MRRLLQVLIGLLFVLYPVAVYFGLNYLQPGMIAGILVALLGIRLWFSGDRGVVDVRRLKQFIVPALIVACVAVVLINELIVVKFYPVLVSSALLAYFIYSLYSPPTAIERMARMSEPDLPESGVRYTRNVTIAWCFFFAINGSVALWTALEGTMEQWTLYNGLISYLLIGLMFAIEYPIRILYRRAHP